MIRLLVWLLAAAYSISPSALQAQPDSGVKKIPLSSAAAGTPVGPVTVLPSSSWEPMTAHRLTRARVLWVNYDLLHDMGITVPPEGMTSEFEQQILDAFAYGVPMPDDAPTLYGEETKTFYADKYGGRGTHAFGSGRAAASGQFQVKGFKTPLAQTVELPELPPLREGLRNYYKIWRERLSILHHTHGGMALRDAMTEAIWGELLHRELPYGSNRTAFILSTGSVMHSEGQVPIKDPRALLVRENSVRPAHFIANVASLRKNVLDEYERAQGLSDQFIEALPKPPTLPANATSGQSLHAGVLEMADRIARQAATEYTHGFYRGASSPSNIEITGRAIDLTAMTALDGFPRATFADAAANGDVTQVTSALLDGIIEDIRRTLPDELVGSLPSEKEVQARAIAAFRQQRDREFLWRTGAPEELLDELADSPKGAELGRVLRQVAQAGNRKKVSVRLRVPRHPGSYDLSEIVNRLASLAAQQDDPQEIERSLRRLVKDAGLRKELATRYSDFYKELVLSGKKAGIQQSAMNEYLRTAASIRNKELGDLYRGPLHWMKFYSPIIQFRVSENPELVQNFVNTQIQKAIRVADDLPAYSVPMASQPIADRGAMLYRIYDAKSDTRATLLLLRKDGDNVLFLGNKVPRDKAMNGRVEIVISKKVFQAEGLPTEDAKHIIFRLPDLDVEAPLQARLFSGPDIYLGADRRSKGLARLSCLTRALRKLF